MKIEFNKYNTIALCGAALLIFGLFLPFVDVKLPGQNLYAAYIDCYNGVRVLIIMLVAIILLVTKQFVHSPYIYTIMMTTIRLLIIMMAISIIWDGFYAPGLAKWFASKNEAGYVLGIGFYANSLGLIAFTVGSFLEYRYNVGKLIVE